MVLKGDNMKSFIMGVLVTLTIVLGIQNRILSNELDKALTEKTIQQNYQKNKARTPVRAVAPQAKVKKPQATKITIVDNTKAEPKKDTRKPHYKPLRTEFSVAQGPEPEKDPRCPDHLPYHSGRWGCTVVLAK